MHKEKNPVILSNQVVSDVPSDVAFFVTHQNSRRKGIICEALQKATASSKTRQNWYSYK